MREKQFKNEQLYIQIAISVVFFIETTDELKDPRVVGHGGGRKGNTRILAGTDASWTEN
jgi:hypothetical protein